MDEYMEAHGYTEEDFEAYSEDPEWQRLNEDLQDDVPSTDLTELDGEVPAEPEQPPEELEPPELPEEPENADGLEKPEREYDEFETMNILDDPSAREFYENGEFYEQGINEYGFEGTCGETSQANTVNALLDTNEWTENKVLDIAVNNDLCEMNSDDPGANGGTNTDQFMELYNKVNEQTGGKLDVQLEEFENAPSLDEMAEKLDSGAKLNVAVDSCELWGQERDYVNPETGEYEDDFYSDHWITVTGVERSPGGEISGFNIIDSGGGESFVEKDRFERCVFGTDEHTVLDPTCITVRKKPEA